MSSRRSSADNQNSIYEVFDSRGIVFGSAVKSSREFVYAQPVACRADLSVPFYVSGILAPRLLATLGCVRYAADAIDSF